METIKETASRKFNQEIRVTNRITNEMYDKYNFDQEHHLDSSKYVEYEFIDQKSDKNVRCIGLFIIEIDDSKLAFDLPDKYENRVILNNITKYLHVRVYSVIELWMAQIR